MVTHQTVIGSHTGTVPRDRPGCVLVAVKLWVKEGTQTIGCRLKVGGETVGLMLMLSKKRGLSAAEACGIDEATKQTHNVGTHRNLRLLYTRSNLPHLVPPSDVLFDVQRGHGVDG